MLERLTFFSDAVFAIAMTLLVIEIRVPHLHELSDRHLGQALLNLLPNYAGFLSSFFVIGRFWVGHHTLFGMLRAADSRLVWSNLFLLATVAFMPFPTAIFSEYLQLRVGVGLYTFWLTLIGVVNLVLTRAALDNPRLVRPDLDPAQRRARRRGAWIAIWIGAISFAAGMVSPLLSLAGLAIGSPVVSRIVRGREGRR
ncbi:DUF1211 domain-containing protein [Sphingomonas aracearum]|uniref:DUF1211 domain-containing protein n=2 Tax=Sphingomonas aracearum TaxID=2283317 RepID=A0A369VVA8_9SPHN|nr:DUF1211 domain-containing protein [Sphingomonas aracearum]